MAKIYYKLIKEGKMTLEEVPEKWREAVRKMLEDDGIVFETSETEDTLIAHRSS